MRHRHPRSVVSPQTNAQVAEASNRADALPCTAPAQWIKSPAWDLVWILNTLWLVPLVLLLGWGHDDIRASPADTLFFVLAVPLWFGHRVSSAWLAYATPAYHALLATQRLRFVVAPLAIAVACFSVLLAPESVLPMPLAERVVWLAILDYLLVSYHFAAQHFGLLSLYRARAGRASDASTRRLDRWFALLVGGGFVVLANALAGSIAFQDRWIDPLLGAGVSDTFVRTLRDGSSIFVVIMTALVLQRRTSLATPIRAARCLRPRRLGHGALRLARARSLRVYRALERAALERRDGTHLAGCFRRATGAWRALATAARAHQPARLGGAARARRRLDPAAARVGGGGCVRRVRFRRPHLRSRRRCGCAPPHSCRRCWHWVSRPASSTTCWIVLPSASPHPM